MIRRAAAIGAMVTQALACGGSDDPGTVVTDSVTREPAAPAESLVATAPGGVEIWYTLARENNAPDGTTCIDRTLEIRREGKRVPVPLLYTGSAPEIVSDTLMRARLSDRCSPGDAYLVDLRSGRPVRER